MNHLFSTQLRNVKQLHQQDQISPTATAKRWLLDCWKHCKSKPLPFQGPRLSALLGDPCPSCGRPSSSWPGLHAPVHGSQPGQRHGGGGGAGERFVVSIFFYPCHHHKVVKRIREDWGQTQLSEDLLRRIDGILDVNSVEHRVMIPKYKHTDMKTQTQIHQYKHTNLKT